MTHYIRSDTATVNPEREDEDYLSSLLDTFQLPNTSQVESEWHRQLQLPLPMHLLYDRYYYILRVDQPHHEPDPGFVRKLKLISPDLSIHWVGRDQRWGYFINHRVYYDVQWQGKIFRVQDMFPMMTEIIQGPRGEYIPPDERSLPQINFNNIDVFGYMHMMETQYEEMVKKKIKTEDDDYWDWQKEYGRQLEGLLCDHFGIERKYQQKVYKNLSGGSNATQTN